MQLESYEMHLHFLSYNDDIKKGSSKNMSILFLPFSMFHAIILLISAQKFCWFTVYEVYKMVCNISVSQNGSEIKPFEVGWEMWNEKNLRNMKLG